MKQNYNKPYKTDKNGRTEKTGRFEKSDRRDKPERSEKPERRGKPDKWEKPDRRNRQDRTERTERRERPERTDRFEKTDRFERKDRPEKTEESAASFARILLGKTPPQVKKDEVEPLSRMDYNAEIRLKDEAFAEFWQINKLPLKPEPIRRSPRPRHYRTTTKRRVVNIQGKFHLLFSESHKPSGEGLYSYSELEPEEHNAIYKFLLDRINEPAFRLIGFNLNYLIIRGSYTEFTVIFNVHTLNADTVRKLKALSLQLQKLEVNIASAFIYLDPTRSEYYLENLRPKDQLNFKKLFGPDKIFIVINDKKYSFHPTSFSQINQSMIPVMLDLAREMLAVDEKDVRFVDLFCGYGLFTHFLADDFSEATGIEAEGASVRSAIENTPYFSHKSRIRFLAEKIDEETMDSLLPADGKPEVFLLDPPRQGTAEGVIESIAERDPLKVIHIFCGVDEIPRELKLWTKNGYRLKRVAPLDMFPGTPNLEVMLLFIPE
ncbi:MAG: class I SAM-dependent RNA methyltransferase [Ignavibacteria bacterium]|jgi:tRNA/tmRNA/rRNA uracil-C5-methylase (TrmA/RlmC/RlmD family)|nr:class I SAM-dependent RNA methyltransferase [Ignavibacteria bacterium]MCU7498844.1 class I SAM-dependent RNA methyltransferase [Ignavibacteria bacterium]MCU7520791.1 class I SAM-dependent RNA methyltransferase [Ignavibacteria bacterium]MCU7523809.1 class I SAM-dependent RNA methyltransferase [Ignavibacteria bacterium]